jgi:uncharacterized protein YgbK (DUF1537 family)
MNRTRETRWAIVADDLTGAADATGHYAAMYSSAVVFDIESSWPSVEIVAIDTESRYLAEDEAADLVASVVRRSVSQGRSVFKKLDSLLRGNIGIEIAAALAAVSGDQRGLALVAPAFPATGRTTVNGIVHVNGVHHADGRFGGDVAHALASGDLTTGNAPDVLGETTAQLAQRLTQLHAGGLDAIVLDATRDDELERIARAAELLEFPTLLAGSGGLASHIAPDRERRTLQEPAGGIRIDRDASPRTLTIVGSYSELARAQVGELIDAGVHHVPVRPGESSAQRVREETARSVGDVVLTPDLTLAIEKSNASSVAGSLAEAVAAIIDGYDALVLTGGETARAVIDTLGVGSMTVVGEIEPGVVVSRLPGDLPLLVTKAGAFGDSRTLVRTRAALSRTPPQTTKPKSTTLKASI